MTDISTELYRRIDETIHYVWDPLGVSTAPQARDEYYTYLPHIHKLVLDGATVAELSEHLLDIATNHMGLNSQPTLREQTALTVDVIMDWKELLQN